MAHLLLLRFSKNFVWNKEQIQGVHEEIEQNIDNRKYPITKTRKGYCIPNSCEGKFLFYRVKKEIIADFTRDLGGIILNPEPNNITIKDIFRKKTSISEKASVGKLFKLIQYFFKIINMKKRTASVLFVLSILLLSPFCFILGVLVLVNPVNPVPRNMEKRREPFSTTWHHHYIFGMLQDPKDGGQDDVL